MCIFYHGDWAKVNMAWNVFPRFFIKLFIDSIKFFRETGYFVLPRAEKP